MLTFFSTPSKWKVTIQTKFLPKTENPNLRACNKYALEQVPNADEHLERSETKYLLHALRFGFSSVKKPLEFYLHTL